MSWFRLDDADLALIDSMIDKALKVGISQVRAKTLRSLKARIAGQKADQTNHSAYRDAVQTDDELEVDSDAIVSLGDDPGAWVHAWVWVSNDQAGIEDEESAS